MSFTVVIPARYASSRLPGKPLLDIAGKSLLQRVYELAMASAAHRVIIATDDERIHDTATGFGAQVCMTTDKPSSGTERIAEVIDLMRLPQGEIIVNVQGDEPMLPPVLIDLTVRTLMEKTAAAMATLCYPIDNLEELLNPNVVKVTMNTLGYALYFSRAPIPWDRDRFDAQTLSAKMGLPLERGKFFRHLGIYAYRAGFVSQYVITQPSPLEQLEKLEQLRVLDNNQRIAVAVSPKDPGVGVDTPEDLEKVRALLKC
ncbi:MAG: 3-deoxy-manno-octulosonate cytidylyltransferase [Gammaproteobacteria bacterium]|nr:3-deoxy-manno-octulosonate cytidylyltransferase [Gammaproteobacteria bacterium]MDH5801301.1 3-deoxy-manno-octulosonate cytidylyltransferase [Gammaproteobacteria bacterium]